MKHRRLTIEQLRSFKGLENLTDEQAQEDIIALEKLSVIMFELYQQHKTKKLNPEGINEEQTPSQEPLEENNILIRRKRKAPPKKISIEEKMPETEWKPNNKQLTPSALREYEGFEHLADAEAERIVDELRKAAKNSQPAKELQNEG